MRTSTRQTINDAVAVALDPIVSRIVQGVQLGAKQSESEILAAIKAVQPASVDLTQEMADDIVRKIHGPLTISKEFSDYIAQQGQFHDSLTTFQVGYGSDAGRVTVRLKGNGTMTLEFQDFHGASLWMGTFVPPDFGKEPA